MRTPFSPWKSIGRQLAHPRGITGRLVGQAMAQVNRQPNRLAIDALKIEPADKVLELGFGPGRATRILTSMVPQGQVFGIDQSAAMLGQASRYNKHAVLSGRVQLQQGRFDSLPWGAETVDKILAVNVVYFFRSDAGEIREARRVLRPGGMIAIYATDKSTMAGWRVCTPETHRTFDRNDLVPFILSGGFTHKEVSVRSVALAFHISGLVATCQKGIDSHR